LIPPKNMALPTSWLQPLRLWENLFLLFQTTHFVVICYNSCKKLI
jgi:hypothetical protein